MVLTSAWTLSPRGTRLMATSPVSMAKMVPTWK